MLRILAPLVLCFLLGPTGVSAVNAQSQDTAVVPVFSHVFVIVMENHSLDQVLASPDSVNFKSLAAQGAVLSNYYGVAHPSEPNYLALLSGSTQGVADDSTRHVFDAPTLVDSLEASSHTWRGYFEGLPSAGSRVDAAGWFPADYAKKHNPFMFFNGILQNQQRLANVVPLDQFSADDTNGRLPDFSLIVPNECHDMHSCSIGQGDQFLGQMIQRIEASSAWDARAAIFVIFDEGSGSGGCCGSGTGGGRTGALVLSPLVQPGFVSTTPYNHYSLLRTMEDAWGLSPLGHSGDAGVDPITDVFEISVVK